MQIGKNKIRKKGQILLFEKKVKYKNRILIVNINKQNSQNHDN